MNKLLTFLAKPFILVLSILNSIGNKRGENRDGLDLLSHTFETGDNPPVRESKF